MERFGSVDRRVRRVWFRRNDVGIDPFLEGGVGANTPVVK